MQPQCPYDFYELYMSLAWGLPATSHLGVSSISKFHGRMGVLVGYCPHPVTVYIRGPIKDYIYHIIFIIQVLLRGGQYPG